MYEYLYQQVSKLIQNMLSFIYKNLTVHQKHQVYSFVKISAV